MGLRAATSFLTPLGGARPPAPGDLAWFPMVGLGQGAALGGLWWLVARAWPAPVDAAVVVVADLALTGMLHLDGLVDSADGLLPHLERDRRLAVMAEPQVGAFGVVVAGGALLLRFAALSTIQPHVLLLAGLWCLSRTFMAAVVGRQPYARPGGLAGVYQAGPGAAGSGAAGSGSARHGGQTWWPAATAVVVALAALVGWRAVAAPVVAAAGLVAAVGVVALARRRLGGYTGDVLGASGVVLETVGLVVAAARW
jgi:adenosylcobinamide-GDP ribazoletransferase